MARGIPFSVAATVMARISEQKGCAMEFLQLCLAPVTLPFTILLVCVFGYWTLNVVGFVSMDLFDVDLDLDLETDLDVDVDLDVDMDVDVDPDVDMDGDIGLPPWLAVLHYFNVGEVPVMILLSVLIFTMWTISLVLNNYWNPTLSTGLGLLLMVPNFLASPMITKVLTTPFASVFKHAKSGIAKATKIVGRTVIVTTGEVTTSFGQAELNSDNVVVPITLNVRARDGERLGKGDEALVVEHDDSNDTYLVVPFDLGIETGVQK